jgi:hypothetical protein
MDVVGWEVLLDQIGGATHRIKKSTCDDFFNRKGFYVVGGKSLVPIFTPSDLSRSDKFGIPLF